MTEKVSCDCRPHESSLHATCVVGQAPVAMPVPSHTAKAVSLAAVPQSDKVAMPVDGAVQRYHKSEPIAPQDPVGKPVVAPELS